MPDIPHLTAITSLADAHQLIAHDGTDAKRITALNAKTYLGASGATNLDGLSDVAITSPATGHVLRHDGSQFVNVLGSTFFAAPSDLTVSLSSAQTASYTLVLADAGKTVTMNVGSANNLTIPPNSSVAFPVGTVIGIEQLGAGQTTVVAGSGVTVNSRGALLNLAGQYAVASLRKTATDTWILGGDLA